MEAQYEFRGGDEADQVHGAPSALSRSVWAKSSRDGRWLTLPQHLLDTMGVGERLFQDWLAPSVRQRWAECFPGGVTDALALFKFSCATHDVGKASPSFVSQVKSLSRRMAEAGLVSRPFEELREIRKHQPHSVVSAWALEGWFESRGIDEEFAAQIASIAGAHHGRAATRGVVVEVPDRPRGLGGQQWDAVRTELITWASQASGAETRWDEWVGVRLPLNIQVTMTGLLIMADWIASNEAYFELLQLDEQLSPPLSGDQRSRWQRGWDDIALAGPWAPEMPDGDVADLYRARFAWPSTWSPNAVQRRMAESARDSRPGLMILEAPMGSGKTEAALMAAEIWAARTGDHGLLVTLPTQATTNAMFDRVAEWLEALPTPMEVHVPWSFVLGHGKAMLNPRYAEMVNRARAADAEYERALAHIYDDEAGIGDDADETAGDEGARAMAHQWFNGPKRRLLNNFAVTTIDQLLLAGTMRKHQMLSHLALASKVVIIDEAHASDSYMNVFLDAVLPWLGSFGSPLIVLSATLTPARRAALVEAYCNRALTAEERQVLGDTRYPLISLAHGDGIDAIHQPMGTTSVAVGWEWSAEDDELLRHRIAELFTDGEGCVLIVRNTVKDAQQTFDALSGHGFPVTLHHSRFIAADRARSDAWLVDHFGRDGERPRKHVVVATQVVEQSLDVDFDLLITDLAPMDLLFQRIGRMHRHLRPRPPGLERPRMVVLRDPDDDAIPRASAGSRTVYGEHWLLRTAAVLEGHGHEFAMPQDIAPLVAKALGDDVVGPAHWQAEMSEAARLHHLAEAQREQRALVYALPAEDREPDATMANWFTLSYGSRDEAVAAAMVRDTEPSVEVLVAITNPDGQVVRPPWMTAGIEDILDIRADLLRCESEGSANLAREVATWTTTLPPSLTRYPDRIEEVLRLLEGQHAPRTWAWLQHPLLARQLVLVMKQVEEGSFTVESTLFEGVPGGGVLRYSPDRGMEVVTHA